MKFASSISVELCPHKKQFIKGKWRQCCYCNFYSLIFAHDLHDLERCSVECRNFLPTRLLSQTLIALKTPIMSMNIVRHLYFPECSCWVTLTLPSLSLGCDSKAIINLLCARTNAQRQKIELEYKTMYGRVRLHSILYFLFP